MLIVTHETKQYIDIFAGKWYIRILSKQGGLCWNPTGKQERIERYIYKRLLTNDKQHKIYNLKLRNNICVRCVCTLLNCDIGKNPPVGGAGTLPGGPHGSALALLLGRRQRCPLRGRGCWRCGRLVADRTQFGRSAVVGRGRHTAGRRCRRIAS